MVIQHPSRKQKQRGAFLGELTVAVALLTGALLPIAYSFASEKRLARSCYERAVAMEIVDGEMEVLMSGAWREFSTGTHDYPVQGRAATNLTAGRFLVTVDSRRVRLEWRPDAKHHGGSVVREGTIQ